MVKYLERPFEVDSDFQTPANVCRYMVDLVPDFAVKILEPTPGKGNLVSELSKRNRYQITAAGDFFLLNTEVQFDCIVMNPPFSSKSAFMNNAPEGSEITGMKLGYYILKKCMKMSDHVIALMPWYTIADSDVRLRQLQEFGIKSITQLHRKTFRYARVQTVVIELQNGYQSPTIFRTLPKQYQ